MKRQGTYRPGVVAIIRSSGGLVLLGERVNEAGAWQLPQGGIDPGETAERALHREIFEEVGVRGLVVESQTQSFISYEWPDHVFPHSGHAGQQHIYFVLNGDSIDFAALLPTEEFVRFEWRAIESVLNSIVAWKRDAYVTAFRELGLI